MTSTLVKLESVYFQLLLPTFRCFMNNANRSHISLYDEHFLQWTHFQQPA